MTAPESLFDVELLESYQEQIDSIKGKQASLARLIIIDKDNFSLNQRFYVWAKYITKKEKPWVIYQDAYPIIGQMIDDCFPYDYDKCREYDWVFFLDAAMDNLDECKDPKISASEYHEARFPTQGHVDALKEEMMKLNFGSFVMDW